MYNFLDALMSLRSKHEKIAKILSFTSLENFIENLSSIEYTLQSLTQEPQESIVPLEANFQIPNVFLKTKKSFKVEKLFLEKELSGEWNDQLDKAIEFFSGIELDIPETDEAHKLDERLLERLLRWRNSVASNK